MKITEQAIVGKKNREECEDGIVVNDNFITVIDGSTSKTPIRIKDGCSNGRYCMELIRRYIDTMPADISAYGFCDGMTGYIYSKYLEHGMDTARLKLYPTERLTASAVIYSAYRRQIWMIGDCQCMAGGQIYENSKPQESILAGKRSAFIKQALAQGLTIEEVQTKDPGRAFIINELIESCRDQNIGYSVIDGFPIPKHKIKIIDVDKDCNEIILSSDGYPFLKPTLEESENALKEQLRKDPLCIDTFKATKGLMKGNVSFDDRSYIRVCLTPDQ